MPMYTSHSMRLTMIPVAAFAILSVVAGGCFDSKSGSTPNAAVPAASDPISSSTDEKSVSEQAGGADLASTAAAPTAKPDAAAGTETEPEKGKTQSQPASQPAQNDTTESRPTANDSVPMEPSAEKPTAATKSEPMQTDPSQRRLPEANVGINDPLSEEERSSPVDDFVTPDQIAAKAFAPPEGAKQLSKRNVWIDREKQRVYVDGYVAMQDGPLEMFACPAGTKEHESVVATVAKSSELHAALLAIGAQSGTPVSFLPKFVPATGQRIRVWVSYLDEAGEFQVIDARQWVQKSGTEETMTYDWVFAGSGFWKDPSNGREYYRADSGDMICVSNFSTAMLDLPVASSADADDLLYSPFTARIPERGTPVRLVLVPIPITSDKQDTEAESDITKPPTAEILRPAADPK